MEMLSELKAERREVDVPYCQLNDIRYALEKSTSEQFFKNEPKLLIFYGDYRKQRVSQQKQMLLDLLVDNIHASDQTMKRKV